NVEPGTEDSQDQEAAVPEAAEEEVLQGEGIDVSKEAFDPEVIPEKAKYNQSDLIIKFRSSVSDTDKSNLVKKLGKLVKKSGKRNVNLIRLNDKDIRKYIKLLKDNPKVEYVQPNYIRSKAVLPNDQWLSDQWGLEAVHATEAWEPMNPVSPVTVAVIDEGVDKTHEDLAGRISNEGYDFVNNDNDPSPMSSDEEHGTHVAGIIAGTANNSKGIAGVAGIAPIEILPLRVLGPNGGSDYDIAEAIIYAADHGASVINMSLGGPGYSPLLEDAVEYAQDRGVVVVAAAGNEDDYANNYSPASISGVVTVAAVDYNNERAEFSNYGSVVDIAAPGVDILSTIPGNKYESWNGTSMATPFVSGAAALLISCYPELSADAIVEKLYNNTQDLGTDGKDNYFGYGMLDVFAALNDEREPGVSIAYPEENIEIFGKINVKASCFQIDNAVKLELLMDDSQIGEVLGRPEDGVYTYELDTARYSDGAHTLTVRVYYDEISYYEATRTLTIKNKVGTGVRVKVEDKGLAVKNAHVEIFAPDGWGNIRYIAQAQTDDQGVVSFTGADFPDGNNYLVIAQYNKYEKTIEEAGEVKEIWHDATQSMVVKAPGMASFDGNGLMLVDFVMPEIVEDDWDSSQAVVTMTPAFKDSDTGDLMPSGIAYPALRNAKGDNKAYIGEGAYWFTYKSRCYDFEDILTAYLLSSGEKNISSESNVVSFDQSNVAQLKPQRGGNSDYLGDNGMFYLNSKETSWHSFYISYVDGNNIINVTPGQYALEYDPYINDFNNPNKILWLINQGEGEDNLVGIEQQTYNITYGGNFTGAVNIVDEFMGEDKDLVVPKEKLRINSDFRDAYNNRLTMVEDLSGYEILKSKTADIMILKKPDGTKQRLLWNKAENTWTAMSEQKLVYPAYEIISNGLVYDRLDEYKNRVSYYDAYYEFNQDAPSGSYTVKVSIPEPRIGTGIISANDSLTLTRNATFGGIKLTVNLPEGRTADKVRVRLFDSAGGYEAGGVEEGDIKALSLINNEVFVPYIPDGAYRLSVNVATKQGDDVLFLEDIVVGEGSREFVLNSAELQKVTFRLLDEGGEELRDVMILCSTDGNSIVESNFVTRFRGDMGSGSAYMPKGIYDFAAVGFGDEYYDEEADEFFTSYTPRFIVKSNIAINEDTSNLDFTSDNLSEITFDIEEDSYEYVDIFFQNQDNRLLAYFQDISDGEKLLVTPDAGNYDIEASTYKSVEGDIWEYVIVSEAKD
ncbi:MAG TPA: S8 family serine peptidase, partial [Candidatus Nitrosocosmicus sp.]|nr:S8 family serine peptidase [Candidatus Nitrosocosmicus sp.]